MTLNRPSGYKFVLLLLLTMLQARVFAGGFPLRPGRFLLSPSASYFWANREWNANSHLMPFPNHGKFNSITAAWYMEYGISRRLSFIGTLPYSINNYQDDTYHPGAIQGFTDLETGLKYYLANISYQYYFSVQGTVITPLYKNLALGYGQTGAEFKASFAGSFMMFGNNCYFNLDDGIRQYFGSIGPLQGRYSGTVGMTLNKSLKDQVSLSLGGFYTTSKYKTLTPYQVANFYTSTNFSFKQVSLSYGHSFSRDFTVFLTGSQFIAGRNTGEGTSASLSLIYRIDTR
ncbi:MAG: hypothetical protein JST19_01060 [Bacteroidetes bacterium]|nr:hypothetical protein [Bacteroidota bacterium]